MAESTLTIVGNLTGDPELRFTPSGAAVADFTVAVTPRSFDKAANEWRDGETMFLRCAAWNRQAENVAESLHKGCRVVVTGSLKARSYEAQDSAGQPYKRTVFEVQVDEVAVSLRFSTAKPVRNSSDSTAPGRRVAAVPAAS